MLLFLCCYGVLQIRAEIYRATTKDLLGTFRAALEIFLPRLLKLYQARKGAFNQDMENIWEKLDKQADLSVKHKELRVGVLGQVA